MGIFKLIGHAGVPTPSLHANSLTGICVGTSSRVQLLPRVAYSPHDHATSHQSIYVSLVPGRDHQSWCLALSGQAQFYVSSGGVEAAIIL